MKKIISLTNDKEYKCNLLIVDDKSEGLLKVAAVFSILQNLKDFRKF